MFEIMTWLAIGVLVFGSLGIFVWFVFDAWRLLGGLPKRGRGVDPLSD